MKLVKNWKSASRMLSVQTSAVFAAVTATYGLMYEQLSRTLPPSVMGWFVVIMFVVNIAVRLIDQGLGSSDE